MDKKTIIAIVLCALIFILYPIFLQKVAPKRAVVDQPKTGEITQASSDQTAMPSDILPSLRPRPSQEVAEEEFFIQTDLYNVVLSNYGGTIKRLEFKKYKDKNGKEIAILSDEISSMRALSFTRIGQYGDLSNAIFSGRIQDKEVVFEHTIDGTMTVQKIYSFSQDTYEIKVKVVFKNLSGNEIKIDGYTFVLGSILPVDPKAGVGELGIDSLLEDQTVHREKTGKIKAETKTKGPFIWSGIQDQYYALMVKPASKINEVTVDPILGDKNKPKGFVSFITLGQCVVPAGGSHEEDLFFFAGPKEYKIMKTLPYHFGKIVNFGIFAWFSIAILIALNFFYKVFRNYGIAIIVVTVVIKLLMYPFTAKSLQSMKKMQEIQPLVNEIRAKNKDNPQKMQKEMMMVYKEYKVNPMSGCLPMLAQLPVFIALFNTLRSAIELKGASFLWVKDLSTPDTIAMISGIPINILPLIMGVTMVWQQKLTPSADPSQAKMMMIMPVIFTFMFYSFPSGLVLYWLVNNVLSIAQQYQVMAKK